MQVIIPSKGRDKTISTHLIFQDCPDAQVTVLVHNKDELEDYMQNLSVAEQLLVTDVKADAYGLTRQREWAVNHLVEPGEWFVFADDDIRRIECLPEPWYSEDTLELPFKGSPLWRARYRTTCTGDRFIQEIVPDMIELAKDIGAHLCGFATTDNYYFRSVHWRTVGYVKGGLMVLQNCGVPYNHSITMEDFRYTAEHLLRYGKILINNYARANAGEYRPGGMGTYDARIVRRWRDCRALISRYPGLFRVKNLKYAIPNTDVGLRTYNEERIEKWRQTMRKPLKNRQKTPIVKEY